MTVSSAVAGTRVQRKLETRQRLIDAAAAIAAERGFANVGVLDVAERAGLSTGAIYSNFRSREQLLMEVATSEVEAAVHDVASESTPQDPIEFARQAAWVHNDPKARRLIALQMEFYQLALRDAGLREEMKKRNEVPLAVVTEMLENSADATFEPLPKPPMSQVAEAFIAMLQGLQQQRLIAPEKVPEELFIWCAQALVRAVHHTEGS